MARVRLGELLLARGICTREQLSTAWQQKVLYGDRLGTSLLALGYIDEATIANALGQQFGVHGGHAGNIRVDAAAVALVPAATAIKRQVLPHSVVGPTLYLLMIDPDDARAIAEVAAITHLQVQPVVVVESRMWALLQQFHQASPSVRPNPLLTPSSPPPTTTTSSTYTGAENELLSESDFNEMYARLAQAPVDLGFGIVKPAGEKRPDTIDLVETVDAEVSADTSADGDAVPELAPLSVPHVQAEASMPVAAATSTTPPTPSPSSSTTPTTGTWATPAVRAQLRSIGLPEIDLVEAIDGVDAGAKSPWSIPPTNTSLVQNVDTSPVSFTVAVERLKVVKTRDDIARVALRAALTRFQRACLLTVYPDAVVGWQGMGEGFEHVADVVIRRDAPSVFDLVANNRAHYIGPLQRFTAHGAWVKATGKRIPRALFVMPILVRGQTVSLLVADNGADGVGDADVSELLILAQHIAASFESLIEQQ